MAEKIAGHNQVVKGWLLIKVNLSTSVSDIYYGGEVQEIHSNMKERKNQERLVNKEFTPIVVEGKKWQWRG